jgi:hypothetical protein
MTINFDMFRSFMIHGNGCNMSYGLVITKHFYWSLMVDSQIFYYLFNSNQLACGRCHDSIFRFGTRVCHDILFLVSPCNYIYTYKCAKIGSKLPIKASGPICIGIATYFVRVIIFKINSQPVCTLQVPRHLNEMS